MEKKGVKKIVKKIFYRVCFWQLKAVEFIKNNVMLKTEQKNEQTSDDLLTDHDAVRLNVTIADVYDNRDGIVTIVSDDGFYESGVLLNELLKKYHISATVAGAVNFVKPNLKGWKKIISEGYIEMVSHSYHHIALREESEISREKDRLYYELIRSAKWHEKQFPKNGKQIAFVCPEGAMCEMGNKVLDENGFYAVRRAGQGFNSLSPSEGTRPGEWFSLNVQGICEKGVNSKSREEWVDETIDKHLWLIEMWHNVMEKQDGFYQTILKDEAEEHIAYISKLQKEERIWVATLTDATKYIREKQNTNVEACMRDNDILVKATFHGDCLSEKIFNYPLTIKICLPDEIKEKSFYLDGIQLPVTEEGILMVNIIPNGNIFTIKQNI